ncbi:MAG: tyrosine-type recombinase/integrase [Candidatus Brocadiaceae bacterium]|nr:tyrosine-type recombinase/integrase [Candidatus Brocadiaceae bacterium]
MAGLNYHKKAKQFYFAPIVEGKRLTVYLGKDEEQAKIAYREYVSKIKRHKKKLKKNSAKKTAEEKLSGMISQLEKQHRKPKDTYPCLPKMLFHLSANQYCVNISVNRKRRTIYLGRGKEAAVLQYHEYMARYVKDRKSLLKGPYMTFKKLVELYLENIKNRVTSTTRKGYASNLRVFCDFLSVHKITEISRIDIELIDRFRYYLLNEKELKIRKRNGVSKSTVNRYLTNIKSVLNWGLEYGKITYTNVKIHKIRKEPAKRPVPRFLCKEEIERILHYDQYISRYANKSAIRTTIPQLIGMVKFMIVTGRRIQEVLALKKVDIEIEQGYYVVTNDKTERTNPVQKIFHLNDAALEIIRPLYDVRKEGEYIFGDTYGKRLTTRAVGQRFKRLLSRLGIHGVAFKELRHTFASHMRMAGEPIENIRDHLGHTSVKTTEIYAHIGENHLKKSINNPKMNELVKYRASAPPAREKSPEQKACDSAGNTSDVLHYGH